MSHESLGTVLADSFLDESLGTVPNDSLDNLYRIRIQSKKRIAVWDSPGGAGKMLTETIVIYIVVVIITIAGAVLFFVAKSKTGHFDGGEYTYEDEVLEQPEDMREK